VVMAVVVVSKFFFFRSQTGKGCLPTPFSGI
jgi:hypothetical protein